METLKFKRVNVRCGQLVNRIRFFHLLIPDAGTRLSGKSTEDYDGELGKWERFMETSFPPGKVEAFIYKISAKAMLSTLKRNEFGNST